jgi:hypothetical protein
MTIDNLGTVVLCALALLMQWSGAYTYDFQAAVLTGTSIWWIHMRKQWVDYQLQRRINEL